MNFKERKGITLIALVITIVIMLILAGISINLVVGQNGIISRAKEAKAKSEKQSIIEEIKFEIATAEIDNSENILKEEVESILIKYGKIEDDVLVTNKGKYMIPISEIYENWSNVIRDSNNLVDITMLQYGKRVVNNVVNDDNNFVSTSQIEIIPGKTYISSRNIQNINYYNNEKEFISQENGVGGTYISKGWKVPENASYMIVSFNYSSQYSKSSFESGLWISEYEKDKVFFEKHGKVNTSESVPNNFDTNKIFYDTLYNNSTGQLLCSSEYNFTLLKLKLNNSFYIEGLSNVTLFYFDEELKLINSDLNINNSYQYYMANTSKYNNIKYVGIQWQSKWETSDKINIIYNNNEQELLGKKLVAYGDSITYNYTWANATSSYFGMIGYNRGIGGTTVNETGTSAWVDMDGMYLSRPDMGSKPEGTEGVDYKTILSSMCNDERIATIPTDADIVIFFGGTNGMDEESYRNTLDKIKVRAPKSKIICINLPFRQDEKNISDFSERRNIIDKVAKEYNYPVIDLYNLMGVDESNANLYMADSVHWNVEGNKIIANNVINSIKECIANDYL